MHRRFLASSSIICFGLAAVGAPAAAKDVGIAPFIGNGIDAKKTALITGMVSGELEFSTEYDFAEEMGAPPAGLNAWCLDNAGCLGNIARSAGTDHLVTGMVSPADAEHYTLYMVLFDTGTNSFVRKKTFTPERSSEKMADAMGGYLKELITGVNPEAAAAATAVASADEFADDDDEGDFFAPAASASRVIATPTGGGGQLVDRVDPAEEARKREEAARLAAEEDARRRAEEDARRRAEAEARRRAEEEERRRAEEQKAAAAAALASQDVIFQDISAEDIQVEDIDFGNALDFIAVEEAGGYEAPPEDNFAVADASSYGRRASDDYEPLDLEEAEPRRARSEDRGNDRGSERSRGDSGSKGTIDGPSDERFAVTAHLGYTHYKVMDFLGYGAELSLQVVGGFYLKTGIEALNVRQVNDEASDPTVNLLVREWHTITPLHVGLAWSGGSGVVRPYLGGDITVTPYTVSPVKVAPGVRARVGANFMLTDAFGLNLNAAAGFWYGSDWDQIEAGMSDGGLVPQVSGGTVFVF